MQDTRYNQMRRIAAQNASRIRAKAAEAPAFGPMFIAIGALSLIVAALATLQSF